MKADGSDQTNLTNNPGVMDIWPSLSLNGREIIYLTNANNQWDSWIMNADGSNKRKKTDRIGIASVISWKP
jgi:Tol biopolymer transport system component